MFPKVLALALLATALAADEMRNTKRSLSGLGISPWNSVLGGAGSQFGWNPNAFGQGGGLGSFGSPYSGKPLHLAGSTAADVAAAVHAAKEATAAAHLAQQRVQAAREQVVIQERVAAAKEAAAQAAIQRSEAAAQVAAAIHRSEALAAAAAAVHKSAAASAASAAAASAAGHFSSGPWNPKAVFNHWG
ncbi:hypothetical protein RUM43_011676 [Polyplax serrata]|uniref:Uncharacterized protein n=1 Tax=Polyplax serrata TaxID=468196 RepID=A0AAN8NMT4_POLSC